MMASYIKKIFANEFYKGGILLTISSFVVNCFNYIFNVFVGRSVGPVGYGEITTLLSYTAIVSIPVAVLGTMVLQKISAADENRYNIARSLEDYFLLKIKKWWFLLILLLAATPFIHKLTNLALFSSYILLPMIIFGILGSFYGSTIQGLRLFGTIAIISIIASVIKMGGPLIGMLVPFSLQTILLFLFFSSVYVFFMQRLYVHKALKKNAAKTLVIEKRLSSLWLNRQFWITTISVLATTFFTNVDVIYVKKFLPSYDAGIYSAWMLFAKIVLYVIGPITALSFIYFASGNNNRQQNKTLIISLCGLLILGLAMFLLYSIVGKFIILLLLGNNFLPMVPVLGMAGIFGMLYTAIMLFNSYFLAKNSWHTIILPAGMIVYVFLLFLIPKQLIHIFILDILFAIGIVGLYTGSFLFELRKNKTKL